MSDRTDSAARYVEAIVSELRPGLRKVPARSESALTSEELCNVRAKEAFEGAIARAGLAEYSVRDLALVFGVKRSKLYERMSRRRTDLAPLQEWFELLERRAAWNRLNAEFCTRSA